MTDKPLLCHHGLNPELVIQKALRKVPCCHPVGIPRQEVQVHHLEHMMLASTLRNIRCPYLLIGQVFWLAIDIGMVCPRIGMLQLCHPSRLRGHPSGVVVDQRHGRRSKAGGS